MEQNRSPLGPGERWVVRIDPETGRVSEGIDPNWLLAPFLGAVYGSWHQTSPRTSDPPDRIFLAVAVGRPGSVLEPGPAEGIGEMREVIVFSRGRDERA